MDSCGAEIQRLSDGYTKITGHSEFEGSEHGGSINIYMFTGAEFDNGPEALGYMRVLLARARNWNDAVHPGPISPPNLP